MYYVFNFFSWLYITRNRYQACSVFRWLTSSSLTLVLNYLNNIKVYIRGGVAYWYYKYFYQDFYNLIVINPFKGNEPHIHEVLFCTTGKHKNSEYSFKPYLLFAGMLCFFFQFCVLKSKWSFCRLFWKSFWTCTVFFNYAVINYQE